MVYLHDSITRNTRGENGEKSVWYNNCPNVLPEIIPSRSQSSDKDMTAVVYLGEDATRMRSETGKEARKQDV